MDEQTRVWTFMKIVLATMDEQTAQIDELRLALEQMSERLAAIDHQIFPDGFRPDDLPMFTALVDFCENSKRQLTEFDERITTNAKQLHQVAEALTDHLSDDY